MLKVYDSPFKKIRVGNYFDGGYVICEMCDGYDAYDGSKAAFAAIWESIYGLGSYIANPLVWVVSFQKI